MSESSKIEWCDSSFNPWIGCTKISPGCDNCYAERDMDIRRHRVKWGAGQARSRTSEAYWKQPLRWNARGFWQCGGCGWRGENPDTEGCPSCALLGTLMPARRRVFCASLADVFDNEVETAWRLDLFTLIASTPNLDWLLLTKRIGNADAMIADVMRARPWNAKWPWPNVWLGATVVNQAEADRDIPKLLATPARVRFLSCEPLLGPISFEGRWVEHADSRMHENWLERIDWVIGGGESGPHARPVHPDWIRSLRDQCAAVDVPFLFKQWGEWLLHTPMAGGDLGGDVRSGRVTSVHRGGETDEQVYEKSGGRSTLPGTRYVARVGKKKAGRMLDGREHSEFPEAA